MELIGLKVKHAIFGAGVIAAQVDNYVTEEFAAKTTTFVYPDSFEKFIKAEDESVQAAIVAEINAMKVAADQKRQAEETARKIAEEQRRAVTAVVAPRAKKSKSLDELFAPDYHVEKMAKQRKQVYTLYKFILCKKESMHYESWRNTYKRHIQRLQTAGSSVLSARLCVG